MDSVVERLIVAVGAQVDGPSTRAALDWYGSLSVAAGTAAIAVAGLAVATARDIDIQADAAKTLGATVEEYTALAYAAELSGSSAEKLGASMRALQMRIAAVAAGSAEAKKDFAGLGIDITGSERAVDVLPRLADALQGLPDGERLGMQLRLLGEGGAQMSDLLAGGSAGIEALTDRAERLGGVISTDLAEDSARLMDSLGDLQVVARGFTRQLVAGVIPALAVGAEQMVELASASDGFASVAVDRAARAAGIGLDFLVTPAGKAAAGITAVGAAIGLVQGAPGMLAALGRISPGAASAARSLGSLALRAGPTALALTGVALVIDDLIVGARGGDSAILDLAAAMGVGEEAAYALSGAGDLVASSWAAVPTVLDGVSSALRALGEAVPSLQPLLDLLPDLDVGGPLEWLGSQFRRAAEGYGELARFGAGDESVQLSGEGVSLGTGLLAAPIEALSVAAVGAAAAGRADLRGEDVGGAVLQSFGGDERGQIGQALSGYGQAGRFVAENPQYMNVGYAVGKAVQVQVDVSGAMDARAVAAQAGRETERGVYDALQAVSEQ